MVIGKPHAAVRGVLYATGSVGEALLLKCGHRTDIAQTAKVASESDELTELPTCGLAG
jgi:hypothetical protein